jgi:hypothetical protein
VELDEIKPGARLLGRGSTRIGTVDAVFADYLLVRSAGLLPVDLYVPRTDVTFGPLGPHVDAGRDEAYHRWHRPLKQAPHE